MEVTLSAFGLSGVCAVLQLSKKNMIALIPPLTPHYEIAYPPEGVVKIPPQKQFRGLHPPPPPHYSMFGRTKGAIFKS